jgi:regulator of sigma E protease
MSITTILIFLVILSVLVFVHELGHFILAKLAKVRVDEFAIGFPPRIFSYKPKNDETRYSINLIPFGGYVKMFGENPDETNASVDKNSFVRKSKWWQVAILLAGVTFNVIFAWFVISLGLTIGLPTSTSGYEKYHFDDARLTITSVLPESPAAKAGLKMGDTILFAETESHEGGVTVQGDELSPESVQKLIQSSAGKPVRVLIARNGSNQTISVEPKQGIIEGKQAVGIAMDTVGTLKLPIHKALYEGARITVGMTYSIAKGTLDFIGQAIIGNGNMSAVSGPVGIAGMVGDARALGFVYLLSFTALISMNLAVLNLLPFPALDGGRVLFVVIEAIMRKPIKAKIANTVNLIGFSILILLMVLITGKEILGIFLK